MKMLAFAFLIKHFATTKNLNTRKSRYCRISEFGRKNMYHIFWLVGCV